VSVVEFRAVDGGGIRPGEFQEFALSGGPFPKGGGQLSFPTVQTYDDGSESAWLEPTVEGQAEPEHPAPVLPLTGATTDTSTAGATHGATTTATDTAAASTGHTEAGPGALALLVSIGALFTGVAGVVLGWRAGRRTVSS
jgi:hypothetical protein